MAVNIASDIFAQTPFYEDCSCLSFQIYLLYVVICSYYTYLQFDLNNGRADLFTVTTNPAHGSGKQCAHSEVQI